MGIWRNWLSNLIRADVSGPPRPAARASLPRPSGQPTYAYGIGTYKNYLPRELDFRLISQFYRSVPALGRAIDILAGFVGCPDFVVENEAATEDLRAWSKRVQHGYVGCGLSSWLYDHLAQALLYGYSVGEMAADEPVTDLDRLWGYHSASLMFRTDSMGRISVVQTHSALGEKELDPTTTVLTVHRPEGSSPLGKSLFFSSPTFCQIWQEVTYSHRATWRRSGTPRYHIHVQLPEDLHDPDGGTASAILAEIESQWNQGMKAAVIDGQIEDFFTANVGQTSVTAIGADAALLDIEPTKRAIVEEIVTATGIPAWMLGYSWSTTERLSTQQADMLLATVDTLRRTAEPALRTIVDTRQRLALQREGLEYEVVWPDVNLQDLLQTAQAAAAEAQAAEKREAVGRRLWTAGVFDQARYAEYVTGSDEVVVEMDEPPAPEPLMPEGEGLGALLAEYGLPSGDYGAGFGRCEGH